MSLPPCRRALRQLGDGWQWDRCGCSMRVSCSSCKPMPLPRSLPYHPSRPAPFCPRSTPRAARWGHWGTFSCAVAVSAAVFAPAAAPVRHIGQHRAEPSSRDGRERDHFFWWQCQFDVPTKAVPQVYGTLSSGSSPTSKAIWIKDRMRWCPGDRGQAPISSLVLWGGDLACYYVRYNKSCITKLF